ncbi:MAG TPA: hypothetical protein VF338_11695 [Leptolinea sp.]
MTVSKSQIPSTVVDRKLTDDESFKANQFLMTKGYRATQLYMKLAVLTNNKFALSVLNEVVDENRVHVGESLKLLYELAEDEEKVLAYKTKEVEEIITTSEANI